MERLVENQRLLFAVATLAGAIHAFDEVFIAEEAYRAIPAVVLSVGALIAWHRLVPWLRIAVCFAGGFWIGGVFTHWIPMIEDGPQTGDWTSLVSVPFGGVLFLLLGIALLRDLRASS